MESIKKTGARRYYKYYRVDKNDTGVTEIPVNDFKPIRAKPCGALTLDPDSLLFSDIGQAMEKAKDGAQAYIAQLIERGAEGLPELLRYRMDHYEDLNINLVDANIQKEESEMLTDTNFAYKPYKISPDYDDQQ
jgi:hypothetical protein